MVEALEVKNNSPRLNPELDKKGLPSGRISDDVYFKNSAIEIHLSFIIYTSVFRIASDFCKNSKFFDSPNR